MDQIWGGGWQAMASVDAPIYMESAEPHRKIKKAYRPSTKWGMGAYSPRSIIGSENISPTPALTLVLRTDISGTAGASRDQRLSGSKTAVNK